MAMCVYECGREATHIDIYEDYVCAECMGDILITCSTGQDIEDFKALDWAKFPTYGYKE